MKLWIARDFDNHLTLFKERPIYRDGIWCPKTIDSSEFMIDDSLFPEVTHINSPQEVELKLVVEE